MLQVSEAKRIETVGNSERVGNVLGRLYDAAIASGDETVVNEIEEMLEDAVSRLEAVTVKLEAVVTSGRGGR